MTDEEHKKYRMKPGTGKRRRIQTSSNFLQQNVNLDDLPDSLDWRDKKVITKVKN
jgi:hypothetical protein